MPRHRPQQQQQHTFGGHQIELFLLIPKFARLRSPNLAASRIVSLALPSSRSEKPVPLGGVGNVAAAEQELGVDRQHIKPDSKAAAARMVGALAGGIGISVPAGKVGLKAKAKGNGIKWS